MSAWRIEYTDRAAAELLQLDRPAARKVLARLDWFATHFDELAPEPLHGEWKGFFRFRIGDYRVLYSVRANVIRIAVVGHRRDVYR